MSKIAQESASRHNVLEWVHRQAKSCVVGIFLVCVLQKICVRERLILWNNVKEKSNSH